MNFVIFLISTVIFIVFNQAMLLYIRKLKDHGKGARLSFYMTVFNFTIIGVCCILMFN